jgi:hypothetical protein
MSDLSLEDENEAETGTVLIATGTDGFFGSQSILQVRSADRGAYPSDQSHDRSMPQGELIGIEAIGQTDRSPGRGGVGLKGIGDANFFNHPSGWGVFGQGTIGVRGESLHHTDNSGHGGPSAGVDGQGFENGVGVNGHSSAYDGIMGVSEAPDKGGVFGFNSYQGDKAAYGVFGRCNTSEGAGVGAESTVGVGVRGKSDNNDGLVGESEGEGRSGVFGHNTRTQGQAHGVFGRCDSPDGAGVAGWNDAGDAIFGISIQGVAIRGKSTKNDGIIGQAHSLDCSGVYGENTSVHEDAPSEKDSVAGRLTQAHLQTFGVKGRADASNGVGVQGVSKHGIGVNGVSPFGDGVLGETSASGRSGVYGLNTASPGIRIAANAPAGGIWGVTGHADDFNGIGVRGMSKHGYGATLQGGRAPLRLLPAETPGAPTSGGHKMGELFVDSKGDLFFCKTTGTPGTWVKIA